MLAATQFLSTNSPKAIYRPASTYILTPMEGNNISRDPQPVDNRSYIPPPNREPQSVPFLSNLNRQNERVTPPNPNQSSSIPSNTTSSISGSHIMGSANSSLLVDVSTGTPSSLNLTSTNARPNGLGETVDHAQQQAPNATYSRDNSPENAQPPISDAPSLPALTLQTFATLPRKKM
ncbi:hypothetical protein PCANC_26463 [Puccinia coronata f. sp. avenae]|uniref:Uncharacterized protein n=1 Tax=Puccinia coronata f. sp. avenae TaxID=200324 RepID=A0A2N5TRF8_9BASI|nr:hypothetical protein PCANC_26463 [Puccinia coronata f. sp. avenae]PLW28776.1 hypothetical protein PCASD_20793 [Puccinia coronata f. sp. avenae]